MNKPNCYECKWRGDVAGSCHSCCNHPKVKPTRDEPLNAVLALMAAVGRVSSLPIDNPLGVEGNRHGIRNGWFCWPMNFDPVWLESCNGFEGKEVKDNEKIGS